jgi:hypothetical protein
MGVFLWARYPCTRCVSARRPFLEPPQQSTPRSYRGASLIKDSLPLGSHSRNMPRALWWFLEGGLFIMSEVPLYCTALSTNRFSSKRDQLERCPRLLPAGPGQNLALAVICAKFARQR